MSAAVMNTFKHVSATPRGHFVLYFYAAVFRMLNHVIQLSKPDSSELDQLFNSYPFLHQYYVELQQYLPKALHGQSANDWWMKNIVLWEKSCPVSLPLKAMMNNTGMTIDNCLAFMLVGLVDEDSRFGHLFADLQMPLSQRRPTLEFVGQIIASGKIMSAIEDPWTISRPLVNAGLIEILNPDKPRSEWVVRVPSLIWDIARGEVAQQLTPWCRYYKTSDCADIDQLIFQQDIIDRLHNIPRLIRDEKIRTMVIRSDHGCDTIEVLGALARQSGMDMVIADADTPEHIEHIRKHLGSICIMTGALPVIRFDTYPGQTISAPKLDGYKGMCGFMIGLEGGIEMTDAGKNLTMTLPSADNTLRQRYWQQSLSATTIDNLDEIVDRFQVSGGYIRKLAAIAQTQAELLGRKTVCLHDVRHASRTLNRQQLDTLASLLQTKGSWQDLVANDTTSSKLFELQRRCIHRERLGVQLGTGVAYENNKGVRALFTGASGTGKTLAAKILAMELGMDIYRVDLAAVINKFIGETEKNLHQVLSQAEALDVILLLDEGDALLGSRTDVKSSNDRYANTVTNYLLQRLENYQGIVFITTNLVENVDRAFQRRMDVVVPFFMPQQQQRMQILELHLPPDHQVGYEYLQQIAVRCELTGGQIRNAALHACLLSLEEGTALQKIHLTEALRSEYRKAGALFPLGDNKKATWNKDAGMETFVSALASH